MTVATFDTKAATTKENAQVLRADARRETLWLMILCAPALLLVVTVIVVPIGWLFWLSLYDETGALSSANYQRFF